MWNREFIVASSYSCSQLQKMQLLVFYDTSLLIHYLYNVAPWVWACGGVFIPHIELRYMYKKREKKNKYFPFLNSFKYITYLLFHLGRKPNLQRKSRKIADRNLSIVYSNTQSKRCGERKYKSLVFYQSAQQLSLLCDEHHSRQTRLLI